MARRPGRGPTSREVTLAWSIQLGADAHERGRRSPLFETAIVDPDDEDGSVLRRFSPSELTDWTEGAFGANEFEADRWTFLCLLHDDDWANGDGDDLAKRLAELARNARGVVVAAHEERLIDAWLLSKGTARQLAPLPPVAFAPPTTIEGTRDALAVVEVALAALEPAKVKKRAPVVVPSPLLSAENGEPVPASELVAFLQENRWQVKRIAESPRAHPDVIRTCVDFLLSGVWDDIARENLVRLLQQPKCPRAIAEQLASHTSRSIQKACAERLKRD